MPAQSQQQQKLFGLALSVKRGETPRSEASDEVLNIVNSMSEKEIEDFASTPHSELPTKVESQLRNVVREIMRETAIEEAELPNATIPANIKTKLLQAIDKIKDTNLNYNQKLQVIGKVVDSLGIDKAELSKISSKLKTTLESVNEAASRTAMEIGGLTGLNKDAIQKFVDTHNMDIEKVFQYVKKGKLTDRLNFVTAIVGTPGNPVQKRMIKMFGESVNEVSKLTAAQERMKFDLKNLKGTPTEKIIKLILKGKFPNPDPQKLLKLNDSQYDTLLKRITRIGGDSGYEMKYRTLNYSTSELENWAKKRVELVAKELGLGANSKIGEGESVNEAKYPTDLKIGSVILGQGFTMLKGIEGGRYYKIVDMDDFSATLVPSDKNGNVKGSKKVRHKLDSIEGGIKTAKRGDENGIVVIKESVNESLINEEMSTAFLILMNAAIVNGLLIGQMAASGGDGGFTPIADLKAWWNKRKSDKALKSIIAKIKNDKDVVEFMKLTPSQQRGKFRSLIATKLSSDELEYLNKINRSHFKNESLNEISVRAGLKLRTYLNGRSDIVDYELVKPNYYNAVKGGKTNLFKVINSTHSKIKVGSTEDFSTDDVKSQLKAGVMTVLKESVNEGIWPKSKLKSDRFEFELAAELKKNFKGIFYVVGHDLYHNDKKILTIDGDKDSINVIVKKLKSTIKEESVNESKKMFSVHPHSAGSKKFDINVYDGRKNKDGSPFIDVNTANHSLELKDKIQAYKSKGYIEVDNVGKKLGIKYKTESVNEAQVEDFEIGDFIHFKRLNKTGMVTKISGNKVTIRTPQRLITGDIKDVEVLYQDGVNPSINEEKYTIIDPKGNSMGAAEKTQVMLAAKKKGGVQSGHFVVSAKNALKAKRALEKFKGDFKNPKLKDMMSNLFYESKSVNEHKDCGCGCKGTTIGGCNTSLTEGQLNEWRAEEVLQQLGGRKFIAMTGAKNFVKNDKEKSITFKIPRAKDGITHVMITLNASDTYTVNFLSIRGNNIKQKPIKGVYNDKLQSVFTQYTGLYTSL